jgi:hypothetical protein
MYVYYNTARRAYEAGKFTLDEKPDTPFKGEGKAHSSVSEGRPPPPKAYKGSTPRSPAVTITPKIESGATNHSNVEKKKEVSVTRHSITRSYNGSTATSSNGSTRASSNNQSDIMLIDLGTPSTSPQDTIADLGDYSLIDLSTAVMGPNTLIDLGQPEITLSEDFSALMGIFSADATMFKDEGLNVSRILRFGTDHR